MRRVKSVLSASTILFSLFWFPTRGRSTICTWLFNTKLETALFLVVGVNWVSFDTSQFLGQLVEQHFDVLASLRRCLEKKKVHPLGVLLPLFKRNLAAFAHV